jgi:hypothetical protein
MDDGLLVRTAFDAPVRIDVERPIATIPTGARWDDVVTLAQEHGLAAAHGSSGTVGAVGYLVRGGMSFYGRQVGLAANLVRSISVILADGKLVRATANEHADLFWALRGGDGGFGVVTQIEVSLFPMAQVITGGIFWSAEYAEPILDRWQQWCRTAPERASTSMRLLNLPPLPGIPDQIAGRPVIGLDGAVSVPQESDLASGLRILDQMLPPLRAVAEPLLDTWAPKRPAELLLTHLDPPQPLIYQNDHFLLADLGSDGIEALVAVAGPTSGSNLLVVELRQLGGAFATGSANGGVVDHLDAAYAHLALGVPSPVAAPWPRPGTAGCRRNVRSEAAGEAVRRRFLCSRASAA